jgi:hypothetical protein
MNFINWANSNTGFLSFSLTLIYVIATIVLVFIANRQVNVALKLETGRNRPFVDFDLITRDGFVYAEVRNLGPVAAVDVRINISPRVSFPLRGQDIEIPFLEHSIARLPPGKTLSSLVEHWAQMRNKFPTLRFEGSVCYGSLNGPRCQESFVIDLNSEAGTHFVTRKGLHEIAETLGEIQKQISHIGTGFSSPLIRTVDEDRFQQLLRERSEFLEIRLRQEIEKRNSAAVDD